MDCNLKSLKTQSSMFIYCYDLSHYLIDIIVIGIKHDIYTTLYLLSCLAIAINICKVIYIIYKVSHLDFLIQIQ